MPEPGFDLAASSLRADLSDARALAAALATKLEETLPAQTKVQRRGSRLLGRDRRIDRVVVLLGQESFVLTVGGATTEAVRAKTVGGIVIRREELALDEWVEALGRAVAIEATRSEAARLALERLLD
jgi:hypothetical protein